MDIAYLKSYILDNTFIPTILEQLGCHDIRSSDKYYKAANPNGDNKGAITVYLNENISVVDYTRKLSDVEKATYDIFDLVKFFEECNFFQAVKKVCEWIDLDYYTDPEEDLPESIRITELIYELQKEDGEIDADRPVKPISPKILSYYLPYVNDLFGDDGIDYSTQKDFEIGYDPYTNRITIPIRDEIGTLVGVKGRLFSKEVGEDELKYVYIEPCNRSKILYGLYKTLPYIERKGKVYVCESEKGVMQLWSMGIYNAVATGGKNVSSTQIEKLTRLCSDIVFLFDKDVKREELEHLASRFINSVTVYAIIDENGILDEKESPTDNEDKLRKLLSNSIERIK